MSSSIDCRHASLIAFLESRDTQGRLSFDDRPSQDDGCGRQGGGRFGQGNNCASGGGGRRGPYASLPDSIKLTPNGGKAEYTADQLRHESPFKSTRKASKLTIDSPNQVMDAAKKLGIKDPSDIAVIGAAGAKNAEVKISLSGTGDGILVKTFAPVDPDAPHLGGASVGVKINRDRSVEYDFFSPNSVAFNSMADGSLPVSVVSASVMALMSQSLDAAEKNGIKSARTFAAGMSNGRLPRSPDGSFQGFRLWPKFGFDADVDESTSRQFVDQPNSPTLLSREARERYIKTRTLRVQDIVATKAGEEWWARHGHAADMTIDFSDKESAGYKRYKQMVAVGLRAAAKLERQGRSATEYWQWVSSRCGVPTETQARAFLLQIELRNCGTGSGGFQKGNTCAGGVAADVAKGAAKGAIGSALATLGATWFPPLVPKAAAAGAAFGAVKGLYDNQMRPTRVMKAIKKAGMTEDGVASLVKDLGGSPRSSADVKNGSLKLTIKDKDGKKTFGIDVDSDKIVITPSRESGKLTRGEMEKVKSLAEGNSKREVSVIVKSQSPSYVAQLTRMGFKVAANSAGVLAASAVAPFVPGLMGHVIGSTVEAITKKRNGKQRRSLPSLRPRPLDYENK